MVRRARNSANESDACMRAGHRLERGLVLFHVSEEADIGRFEPRSIDGSAARLVWAIDDERLRNYLVPRDCPRVTYYADASASPADVERFIGTSTAVLAFEHAWLTRVRSARLYCYELPPAGFELADACAGYFVSRTAVVPLSVRVVDDCMSELGRRGVEVRVLPDLWSLHDGVAASTLRYSMIRMRNAAPRIA
jgi:hypothetical protein